MNREIERIVAELTGAPDQPTGWEAFDDSSPDLLYCEETAEE